MYLNILVYTTRILAISAVLLLLVFIYFGKTDASSNEAWLINCGMFMLWAMIHSGMSTAFFKRIFTKTFPDKYLRPSFVIISSIGLMAVIYHWQPLDGALWELQGIPLFISTLLFVAFAAGAAINLYAIDYKEFIGIKNLRKAGPQKAPQGDRPDFSLKGMYGYCRHPTYLFLILVLWVTPIMTYTKLEFVVLATLYILVGTFHEETNLRMELGRQYDEYCENVPMWLPKWKPWNPNNEDCSE